MAKILSIVDYIHELKEAGFTDKQAEVQAKHLEQFVAEVKAEVKAEIKQDLEAKELATKGDIRESELRLQKEIAQTNNKTILWIVGIMTGYGVFFLGVLAKGFHWF